MTGDRPTLARQVLRVVQTLDDRMATRTVRLPFGIARLSSDLANVHDLNHVEMNRPTAAIELFPRIEALFEDAGLEHRKVTTYAAEVAWTLASAMYDRGWGAAPLLYMVNDDHVPATVTPLGFGVVDDDTWATHATAFVADTEWGRSRTIQQQMRARDRRLIERTHVRWVLAQDGSAGCHVYRHGRMAQIEDVHVLSEARGQGLGHGLMAKALEVCGDADIVFLVAAADDWPKDWYGRLGFRAVASSWQWLRQLDPEQPAVTA
ncbi:hypothetical protein BH24ACT15_BH24ACT15_04780 [soil metagenome]|jgi:GNAT superfamily N-acetyltransferase